MRFRTVRRALPMEVVLLHHALKAFAFRAADYIDEVARLKLGNAQVDVAFGKIFLQAKFAHESLRPNSGLLEFTEQRFADTRFLLCAEPDLYCKIAFVLFGQTAQQNIIAGRDHSHWT